jgi:hypothetical protein
VKDEVVLRDLAIVFGGSVLVILLLERRAMTP